MNLEEISDNICNELIKSSYIDQADDIKRLMIKVLTLDVSDLIRNAAIDSLISRCHPKWLGDCYIKNITYKEWSDLVTKFNNKLNKEKQMKAGSNPKNQS
ncbi:hypothetical protein N5923_08790 [Erwiniaceae bacterium BAC15a-03b]|uniref:Uncharacterized protein n=1 Tax=Winslowiella arboricola TaxID=2978220 RepID=A0A9J6PMD6_9GAMM|nr:hypothetical protein [Winslowiella arboricola]MCU5771742.1 hypothetical protein [Winslowiella arboricola]MCU5777587.1 hypothetical protein [Winslowiella arboricola]